MPEGPTSIPVSLRVPADLIEMLDKIAAAMERSRSWVMLRALRQYLDDGEGREIEQDTESIAELDRGESVPFEEVLNRLRERVARAEAASKK